MSGNGDVVTKLPDPPLAALPQVLVRVGPQGLEVQSNVPQMLMAIGMLELAKIALMNQAQQGPPSRILRVQ
jgi:hypothetical protein